MQKFKAEGSVTHLLPTNSFVYHAHKILAINRDRFRLSQGADANIVETDQRNNRSDAMR